MKKMNTRIEYKYRDGGNTKNYVSVVVRGEYTTEHVDRIMASLSGGEYFIAPQVGLPDAHFVQYEQDAGDHPWHELEARDFYWTDEEPTLDLSITDLVTAFETASGQWNEQIAENAICYLPDGIFCKMQVQRGDKVYTKDFHSVYHVGTLENLMDAYRACDVKDRILSITECEEEVYTNTEADDKEPVKYLVVTKDDDGETNASMETASWIINYLDMSDCFSYDEIHVYDVSVCGKVEELTLHGPWHDLKNKLYIKVTGEDGRIVFDGVGTDH